MIVRVRVWVMIRVKVRVRLRGGARVRVRVRLRNKGCVPSANDAECSAGLGRPCLTYLRRSVLSLETGISTYLRRNLLPATVTQISNLKTQNSKLKWQN